MVPLRKKKMPTIARHWFWQMFDNLNGLWNKKNQQELLPKLNRHCLQRYYHNSDTALVELPKHVRLHDSKEMGTNCVVFWQIDSIAFENKWRMSNKHIEWINAQVLAQDMIASQLASGATEWYHGSSTWCFMNCGGMEALLTNRSNCSSLEWLPGPDTSHATTQLHSIQTFCINAAVNTN